MRAESGWKPLLRRLLEASLHLRPQRQATHVPADNCIHWYRRISESQDEQGSLCHRPRVRHLFLCLCGHSNTNPITDLPAPYSELLKEMRHVTTTFNTWKDACVNGSAPQINGAAAQVREHMEEATELLDEMQKANGTSFHAH